MTPAGIEPATFRFVVHRLNQCATAVQITLSTFENTERELSQLSPAYFEPSVISQIRLFVLSYKPTQRFIRHRLQKEYPLLIQHVKLSLKGLFFPNNTSSKCLREEHA
jgi:hypothetical protein